MIETAYRFSLFALYQFTVALGILLFPVAILANRVGVELPLGQVVARLGTAYENMDAR